MRTLLPLLLLGACANNPIYFEPDEALEAGLETDAEGEPVPAKAQFLLPINTESEKHIEEREEIQATIESPEVIVPYVRVGDLEVSVEYTIENLAELEGTATVQINGANQFYEYDPELVVLSLDDEAPPTPGLTGDIPIRVAPGATVSGIFTEDDMREAAIDLDQITRGRMNPFRARFTIAKSDPQFEQLTEVMYDEDDEALPQEGTGVIFPRAAFAQMLRLDLVFSASRHMVMRYDIRVRDVRGKLIHELLKTAPADELQYQDPYAAENGFYEAMPPAGPAMQRL